MSTTHKVKYPVVNPSPSFSTAVSNFNIKDILTISAFTVGGYCVGWFGARKPFRVPNSRFVAGIGIIAGISYATLSSSQRLMGLEPNESEVRRYGALEGEELKKRLHDRDILNLELIDSSAKSHDD